MPFIDIIEKITATVKEQPEQTQLSLAVFKNGKTDYFGMIKEDGNVHSIDNKTFAFETGSVTKAFTGYILAQMAIEHKIRLDDPIQDFLPFPILNNPPITLRHLALHTSGLPKNPHDFEMQPNYDKNNPFLNYTEVQLATYFSQNLRLESSPGNRWFYSNLGYGLLSYIISRIEEKPFAEVVAERIFRPLQMRHSTFDIREVRTEMVKGIDEQGNFCTHWDGGLLNGCLGIISTAEDLIGFIARICNLSDRATNVQAMTTFPIEDLVRSNLGWGERLLLPEHIRMLGINGGTGGYGASLLVNRQQNCAVVILSNIWPWTYMERIYPLGKELLIAVSTREEAASLTQ